MGELGYDEFEVIGEAGETVCVRVGGDMEPGEIIVGTCANRKEHPDRCVQLDDDGRRELIEILRRLGPRPRERLRPHEPDTDIEWKVSADAGGPASDSPWRGRCEACDWRGVWKLTEHAAQISAAMHAKHARRGLKRKRPTAGGEG